MFNRICCPNCKEIFKISFSSGESKVLSCSCFEYPFVKGIVYLKKNGLATRAVKLIKQSKSEYVFMTLIHVRFILSIPVRILKFNNIRMRFSEFLYLLQLFGYDRSWSKYLAKRDLDTSFKLSVFSTDFLKKNYKILDLGCGVGQLFPHILSRCRGKNIYGIDTSFLNLFIARRFFTDPDITLICADVEKGLPFVDGFLNAIIATDSFHYIKQKYSLLKEASRVLYSSGLLFIVHTINDSKIVYGNIMAIRPKTIYFMLRKLQFKKINIFPDSDIAYTVFASKGDLLNNVWI